MALRSALAILPSAFVIVGIASAQSLTPTFTDVSYGTHPLQKMDVYLASGVHGAPTPVCVEIHAGGWAAGEKSVFELYGDLVPRMYAKGISIVSIDYPVAPQDLFPAANLSCQRAVQFIRANAAAWHLDPNQIGVLGCSSGAHLAMWVAAAADAANPSSADPVEKFSSRVKACIAYEGPSDLTPEYYEYDDQIGHSTSPVWAFLGAKSQADWDAIPQLTKDQLSPRWHVETGASPDNANVRFLGIFKGDPKIKSSKELTTPTGDIHNLVHGLAFREALVAAGATEVLVWAGSASYSPTLGLFASPFAADWMSIQLTGAKIKTVPGGTPGCLSQEFLSANSAAKLGNANFQIRAYNALPSIPGLLLLTNQVLSTPKDLLDFGFDFVIDPYSPFLIGLDMAFDVMGNGVTPVPVPNDPWLVGQTFYAQVMTVWFDPKTGDYPYCIPSPHGIAASPALSITIE